MTRTPLVKISLHELRQKHDVDITKFLVNGANPLQAALQRAALRFQIGRQGIENDVKRVFSEFKRRNRRFRMFPVTPNPKTGCKPSPPGLIL